MSKKLHLTAVIWREGKQYVSNCPEIGVASCGKTPSAAKRALAEAVELWFSNARRLGIMEDVAPAIDDVERYTSTLDISI